MKVKTQRAVVLAFLLMVAVCGQAFGLHRYIAPRHVRHASIRPGLRRSRTRRVAWNPVFRPSHDSLLRQNLEIDRMELPRIQNDAELEQLKASQDLVPILPSRTLRIDPRLDPSRRYCRPWTRDFLGDLSEAYYQQFHAQIQVNSAVRTVVVQKKLRRHNRNAAPEKGETASSHLAGITVDVQRRGMTRAQVKWVEQYLVPLRDAGLVEPEEERHQWVFHIAVSGRYADLHGPKVASVEQPTEEISVPDSIPVPSTDVASSEPQQ